MDDIQKSRKDSHILRGFSPKSHFIPKYSFQTWPIYRTHSYELLKFNEHKLASHPKSRNVSIFSMNRLTILFSGVLNSRSNSFQLEGHDTIQLNKDITNDTIFFFTIKSVISASKTRSHQTSEGP